MKDMKDTGRAFLGDPTQLQVLRQAAEKEDAGIWNRWRDEHNVERPDLRGADLSKLVLHGVNLQFADLTETRLMGASIVASLDYAVLNGADLTGA